MKGENPPKAKPPKAVVTIGGRELAKPTGFPVSLKEFLRIVVGGSIPSARTETDRMRYYRQFLTAWQSEKTVKTASGLAVGSSVTQKGAHTAQPDVEQIVQQMINRRVRPPRVPPEMPKAKPGFNKWEFEFEAELFLAWQSGLLSRRGKAGADMRWKKKTSRKSLDQPYEPSGVNLASLAAQLARKKVSAGIW
jgi:hypothetical protein